MHPDQGAVAHGAAVYHGAVAYGDVFAQGHRPTNVAVQHGIVLHVAVLAEGQGTVVAAQHGPIPYGGAGLQDHIALHGGVGSHKGRAFIAGTFSTKGQEHCEKPPFSFGSFMVFL